MTLLRALAVLLPVAVFLAPERAWAGHEIPFYASFYPQEVKVEFVEPAAAPRLLEKKAIHAYVGTQPFRRSGAPLHVAYAESLRAWVVLTFNPAAAMFADGPHRCAAAAGVLSVLSASKGDYAFHPYPVTPYHDDYLAHFDLAAAAKKRAAEPPAGAAALRIRAKGRLADLARGAGWRLTAGAWDAALEEVELRDLVAAYETRLNGWSGPPWLKAGWFQAHALYAPRVFDAGARHAIEEAFARRTTGRYESTVEKLNLERRLVSLLTRGCERVAVGYVVRREALNHDYSEGVENIASDAQAGLNSAIFLRTVKLKDFPWNGWLRLGVETKPTAAWNPIAGFSDEPGRLIWSALGDPALFPSPQGAGWVPNRVLPLPSTGAAGGAVEVPPDALVPDPAGGPLRPAGRGMTTKQKLTYRVLLSKFHDGTKMTVADVIYPYAFAYRWAAKDREIDRATAMLRDWLAAVRVVRVDTEIKDFGEIQLIYEIPQVEVYLKHALDPGESAAIAPPWSAVPWQLTALMEEAVARGLAAFSEAEARRRGLPWLELARNRKLKDALAALADTLERRAFIPEALRGLVTVEQAKQRWAALRRFYRTQGHFLVTSGPYQLGKWTADSAVLGVFRDLSYPLPVGAFDQYVHPLRAFVVKAEQRGERLEIRADGERLSKFERSYKIVREPMRLEPTGEKTREPLAAYWAVVGAADTIVAAGSSEALEGGRLVVDLKDKLRPGTYRVLLALALNGNLVNPEVKVIPYRVGD